MALNCVMIGWALLSLFLCTVQGLPDDDLCHNNVTALLPTNVSVSTVPVDVGGMNNESAPVLVQFSAKLLNMTTAQAACFSFAWSAPTSIFNGTISGVSAANFSFPPSTAPTQWTAYLNVFAVTTNKSSTLAYSSNLSAVTYAIRANASFVYMDELAKNWTVDACPSEQFLVMKWTGEGPNTLERIVALRDIRIVGRLPNHMVNNRTVNCSLVVGTVTRVVATGLGAEVTLAALNYTDIFDHLVIDIPDLHAASGLGSTLHVAPHHGGVPTTPLRQVRQATDNIASPARLGMDRSLDCDMSIGADDGLSGSIHCNYNIVDGGLTVTVGAGLGLSVRFPFTYVISGGSLQRAAAGVVGTITGSANVGASLQGNVVVDLTKELFNHRFYCSHFDIHFPCFIMVGPIPIVYLPFIKGSLSNKFSFVDKASISYTRSATLSGAIAVDYVKGVGPGFEHNTQYQPAPPNLDVSASCSMSLGATVEVEAGVRVEYAVEAGATIGLSDTLTYTQPSKECVGATQGELEDAISLDIKGKGKVFGWDVTVPLWKHDFAKEHGCLSGLPSAVCGPAAYECRTPEYECFMSSSGTSGNGSACAATCVMPKTQCTVCGAAGADSCCNCPQYSGPCSSGCAIFCPCPSSEFNACCMPFEGGILFSNRSSKPMQKSEGRRLHGQRRRRRD